jgi:hypothetical protein
VQLVVLRAFQPGSVLVIKLRGSSADSTRLVLARVSRVETQPQGGWLLACDLALSLGDDDLRELLS